MNIIKTSILAGLLAPIGCASAPTPRSDGLIGEFTKPQARCESTSEHGGPGWTERRWNSCAHPNGGGQPGADVIVIRRYEHGAAPTAEAAVSLMMEGRAPTSIATSTDYAISDETVTYVHVVDGASGQPEREWHIATLEDDVIACRQVPQMHRPGPEGAEPGWAQRACMLAISDLVRSRFYE